MTRNEAIDLLDNLIGMIEDNHESDYDTALQMGIKALEQEKTGHWLMTGEVDVFYDLPSYECSKCGQTSLENGDYCPNCGARMVEPQEGDKE